MNYRIVKPARRHATALLAALAGALVSLPVLPPLAGPLVRPAAAAERDSLTIGLTQYPSTLNPLIDSMVAKSYVLGLTQRPLTVYDKDWKLVCLLCTELPTLENGGAVLETRPDGKQGIAVTYKLLPDVRWGDGKPVTAQDLRFTWEVGRHPQSGAAGGEGFRRITDVAVMDDKTVTFHVDRVTFDYNAFGTMLLPAHLEAAKFEDPTQYRVRSLYETEPTNPGLWLGPYRVTQVAAGSHITLERNPAWTGKAPAFKRIVVRAIENTAALESNLLSGAVDMIPGELGLSLEQVIAFEQRRDARFTVLYKPSLFYEHIDLNLDNPLLKDLRVRKALLLALDREGISKQLFAGKQAVAHSFVNALDWIYDTEGVKYSYDRAAAVALLEEAGWKTLRNGIRQNAAGQPLSFEINSTAGNRSRELMEQVLQSEWRKLGIDVKIRNMTARVLFGDFMEKRRFPAMALFGWVSSPESVPRSMLHSDQIPTEANHWQGQNFTGYNDPGTDTLLDKVERELDRDKRRLLWRDLQRRYAEALPVLPLFYRSAPFILPAWLGNIEPTGHQFPTTLWVELDREPVSTGAALLAVEDLAVRFALPAGDLVAVDGVSYALQAGRTLGVVGESGSGKSVTALALLGLLPRTATVTRGRVLWQGRDLTRLDEPALQAIRGRHISLVFQDPMNALNPAMTVGDQVAESLILHQDLARAAAHDGAIHWLRRVGLPDPARQADFYPHELSGGMRQRVTIAIALACQPAVLIADEPTTALDVTVQARILDLLLDLQAEFGLALQFISHNLAVVSEIADEIAVMYAGMIVERGPAARLLATPRHPYTRALLAAVPRPGSRRPPEPIPGTVPALGARTTGCPYVTRCPIAIADCRTVRPSLDEIGGDQAVACLRATEFVEVGPVA